MQCCCKSGNKAVSCSGRCDISKYKCQEMENAKPGPVPKNKGWQYTAKDSPEHQLRCGWRPGHISCQVLRIIAQHNCKKHACCRNSCCHPSCNQPLSYQQPCCEPCCTPTYCYEIYPGFEQ